MGMHLDWGRAARWLAHQARGVCVGLACVVLSACGGGQAEEAGPSSMSQASAAATAAAPEGLAGAGPRVIDANTTVLIPVPSVPATPAVQPSSRVKAAAARVATEAGTSLRVHYRRADGDTSGWQLHSWGAAQSPAWNSGWNASGSDDFGAIYDVPLAADSGTVGYLLHKGDWKDWGGCLLYTSPSPRD